MEQFIYWIITTPAKFTYDGAKQTLIVDITSVNQDLIATIDRVATDNGLKFNQGITITK